MCELTCDILVGLLCAQSELHTSRSKLIAPTTDGEKLGHGGVLSRRSHASWTDGHILNLTTSARIVDRH